MLLLICTIVNSQEVWKWVGSHSGALNDYSYEIATDKNMNVIVAGAYESDTLFVEGDTLTSLGNYDAVVVKRDTDGNLLWSDNFGDDNNDYAKGIATDSLGNIYVTGYYTDSCVFGNDTLLNSGSEDLFLVKYGPDGEKMWGVKAGGSSLDIAYAVKTDTSGYVYICGYYKSASVIFDTETINNTSSGTEDVFVAKYDWDGNLIWVRNAGGTNRDLCFDISVDKFGSTYLTGWYYSTSITFGTQTIINNGWTEIYLLKFDSDGNPLWAFSAGGSLEDEGFGVTNDDDANVYITGNFHSTTFTFGGHTVVSNGERDGFLCKLDAAGNVIWALNVGGNLQDRCEDVEYDYDGHIIVSGWYLSTNMTFAGDGVNNLGNSDAFVAKYDTLGNEIWLNSAGGDSNDYSNCISVDNSGNIYAGAYSGSDDVTFGTHSISGIQAIDFFVAKIAQCEVLMILPDTVYVCDGEEEELIAGEEDIYSYYWSNEATGNSISVDSEGIVWVDITDENNCTDRDSVYVELIISTYIDDVNLCSGSSYTYADGTEHPNITLDESYMSTLTGQAINGCDSIVTENITVLTVDVSVTENGITLNANLSAANYQWIDCNDSNNPISGATNQSFTVTEDGSYAVIIDDGACVDTSICYIIIGVGINVINNTSINIYPNPAENNITFSLENTVSQTECNYEIYSVNGQMVMEGQLIENSNSSVYLNNLVEFQIYIGDLPEGFYTVKIYSGEICNTGKFVKK
jgi:hypothetical protein